MVPSSIIELIFDAATIQRWNDHVRPVELTELDKQAHKAMIAYLLARFEEDKHGDVDWIRLIEGLLFEFLPRVLLTDIKAPFFHRLMQGHGREINEHVLKNLRPELESWNAPLADRFEDYLLRRDPREQERRILNAAHYLATQWEFKIIHHATPFMYGMDATKAEIENQLEDFIDLIGVQKINLQQKAHGFVDLCGQLRFQHRWAQTPRMPRTAVLGHSLFVAILGYLLSLEIGADSRRTRNNFYTGLFHDLPEIFTRDIIAPIKKRIRGMESFIDQEEKYFIRERLLPLIPESWHTEFAYYVDEPFRNRVRIDGEIRVVDAEAIGEKYDDDAYDAVDGDLLKGCDELAAYVEACKSIENGVNPPALVDGARALYERYRTRSVGSIEWRPYFDHFSPP